MSQHGSLTVERWSTFSFDQQILMIANELLRWRDLIASLYRSGASHSTEMDDDASALAALRCLLRFTPEASRQLDALGLTADG